MQRLRPCRNIDDDADNLEQYAPPARRAQVNDADRAVANTVEGEIREFVWRDHQQRSKADAVNESTAGSSAEEIDQVIRELQRVRDMLHGEGERLSGEIARYASLNQWKGASVSRERPRI
jgi:hypothetical protein